MAVADYQARVVTIVILGDEDLFRADRADRTDLVEAFLPFLHGEE